MSLDRTTIRTSHITLRGLYLGSEFVQHHTLEAGKKYAICVEGLESGDLQGTLDKSSFIGGLAKMYRAFDLMEGDEVALAFSNSQIIVKPPAEKRRTELKPSPELVNGTAVEAVFARQKLKHVHIDKYSPGNLSDWEPRTEPDVYMVFGAMDELHDYHYCCGASKELLDKLGYAAATKPDAVVIDSVSDEYLMAEFKIRSSDFKLNHKPEDVDLLVCWVHDETDKTKLPPRVLDLGSRLREAIKNGDIDL